MVAEQQIILDIFGNNIVITNLKEAISQTKIHVGWSEREEMFFTEYKLVESLDQYKRPFSIKKEVENGRKVSNLEFYKHQLKELNKLK